MRGNPSHSRSDRSLFPRILLALAATLLLSCETATPDKIIVDRVPTWRTPSDTREIKVKDLVDYIQLHHPGVKIRWSDKVYERVSYEWLKEYMHWTWNAHWQAGVEYTAESFDCEEFSLSFYLHAARAASEAGQKTSPLIGRMVVRLDHPFSGVEAAPGKTHELVVVATDRGPFVVEPQTHSPHRLVALDKYPNPILSIVFGD